MGFVLGFVMLSRSVALCGAFLCTTQIAGAQEAVAPPVAVVHTADLHVVRGEIPSRDVLENNAARLAVGANLSPDEPSRAQLLGVLVLMSLQQARPVKQGDRKYGKDNFADCRVGRVACACGKPGMGGRTVAARLGDGLCRSKA